MASGRPPVPDQRQRTADDRFMRLAIAEANKSQPVDGAYCVGAVLVAADGSVLSTGFSRELPGNTHAEQCCLEKLPDASAARAGTMYTTMEPCSKRLSGNRPCVDRLVEAGIGRVVVGVPEPANLVVCEGTRILNENGITVDTLVGYEEECLAPNRHILDRPG
ncbi:cytidine deaminase-like protein [Hyaloraphidium curvatum]|nr:cytidine deaminase-like protein [Hyaloraphidium curvatum]